MLDLFAVFAVPSDPCLRIIVNETERKDPRVWSEVFWHHMCICVHTDACNIISHSIFIGIFFTAFTLQYSSGRTIFQNDPWRFNGVLQRYCHDNMYMCSTDIRQEL